MSLSLAWRTRICSGCTASSFLRFASLLLASTLPRQYYDMMFWIKIDIMKTCLRRLPFRRYIHYTVTASHLMASHTAARRLSSLESSARPATWAAVLVTVIICR